MKVAVASDHAAYALKTKILEHLNNRGIKCADFGAEGGLSASDYPDYGLKAANAVASGECSVGILVCGTGIGMSIAANKIKGIRAAVCGDKFSAKATREHNDANILCLGERVISPSLALELVDIFVDTPFSNEERHIRRLDKITAAEGVSC